MMQTALEPYAQAAVAALVMGGATLLYAFLNRKTDTNSAKKLFRVGGIVCLVALTYLLSKLRG